jgi:hypothetical protein
MLKRRSKLADSRCKAGVRWCGNVVTWILAAAAAAAVSSAIWAAPVLTSVSVRPGDATHLAPHAKPPAFSGASCTHEKPDWDLDSATVSEVIGEGKLALHPDFPGNCVAGNSGCDGKAYLVEGNRVTIGVLCGDWADVEYQGHDVTSWGWVESTRLKILGTADALTSMAFDIAPVPAPPICSVARQNLNIELKTPKKSNFPNVLHSLPSQTTESRLVDPNKLPMHVQEALENRNADKGDIGVQHSIVDGLPVELINYGTERGESGDCYAESVQVWSQNFGRLLYAGIPGPVPGDQTYISKEDLVQYGGKTYLERQYDDTSELELYSFGRDVQPQLQCEFIRERRHPEFVKTAVDPRLCDAAAAGKVEEVSMEKSTSKKIDAELLGEPSDFPPGGIWQYSLGDKATVDIYNNGHPLRIGMVKGDVDVDSGCGIHIHAEWPVALDGHNLPDLARLKIDDRGANSRLIRYRGVIYLDSYSSDNSKDPYFHTIWKVSEKGSASMCTFSPNQYYEFQHQTR